MPAKETTNKKKRPGPKPELFSLYPLNFNEAIQLLVKNKTKKDDDKNIVEQKKEKNGKKRASDSN